MRVALCGPFPVDERDAREADGLVMSMALLAECLSRIPEAEVTVVTRSKRTATVREVRRGRYRVITVPDPRPDLDYFLGRRILTGRLTRALRSLGTDIVHAHGEAPFIFAAIESGRPHVVTLHSIFAQQTRPAGVVPPIRFRVAYSLMRSWERAYLPRIRNLIAINREIAEAVRRASPQVRVFEMKNSVSPLFFDLPARPEARVILFVGQISQRKGLHLLLDAFESLCDAEPAWTLRVAGTDIQDPPYTAGLAQKYRHLVDQQRVLFLGGKTHEEILEEMRGCSVLCLPSLYEASPLVVMEAMAAGRTVVATKVGDVEESVRNGETGFLVPPGDVDALRAGLASAMSSDAIRADLGRQARKLASERARPEQAAEGTMAVYSAILASEGEGHESRTKR